MTRCVSSPFLHVMPCCRGCSHTFLTLSYQAGLLPELDILAHKFFTASATARDSVYQEALTVSGSFGAASKHYIRVMEKVVNGSVEYVEKETKR